MSKTVIEKLIYNSLCASAASTNPLNNGCGLFGLDFSSGCA